LEKPLLIGGRVPIDARPEIVGPGWWGSLHMFADVCDRSTNKEARNMFLEYIIQGIGQHFPCLHCRSHAVEYIDKTDNIKAFHRDQKRTCVEWAHKFHETVNARLQKPKGPTIDELNSYHAELREGKGCDKCGGITTSLKKPAAMILHRQLLD
jgi:hypothetical protein